MAFVILLFILCFFMLVFFKFHPLSGFLPRWYLFDFEHLTQSYGQRRKDQQVVCTNSAKVC